MISLNNGHQLPIVGQTRCYWTLLSPALHFLALDPVLAFHLQEQAPLIINRSLLDFVHPEELSYARHDLSSVLRDRTLHGSITRVRYSRLSRVRRLLGFHPSPTSPLYPPSFPAERIAVDENYMAVDIVINWAAEGVVLCFIHAVVDLKPDEDNDEKHKTGWSNWCGTPVFDEKHAGHMFQSLKDAIPDPVSLPYPSDDPSLRVFQILRNGSEKQLLLNWPSELMISEYPYVNSTFTDALARLVDHVQINYGQNSDVNKSNYNSNATTSCTRRYRSFQTLNVPFGQLSRAVQVESVFVPHGSVIFACHKVDGILSNGGLDSRANTQRPTSDLGWVLGHPEENKPRMYTTDPSPYDPELMGGNGYSMRTTQNQPQSWMQLPDDPLRLPELDHNGHPGLDHNVYTKHSSSPVPSQDDMWSRHTSALGSSSARTGFNTSTSQLSTPQSLPQAPSPINATAQGSSPSNGSRTGSSKRSCSPDETPKPPPSGPSWTQNALSEKSTASSSTVPRNVTKPPIGVLRCASCKTANSPEWRKGPSGKKELCNACGLRYARSRARKEGVTPRRRKDKFIAFSSLQQPTPSTTAQLPSANGFDAQHLPVESSQYNGTRYEDSMSRTTTDPVALVQRDGSTLNSNEALYQSRAAGSATPDLSSSIYRSDYSQVSAGGVKASDTSSYYDSDSEARGYSGADSNRVMLMHGTPTTSGGHLDHSSSYSQMTTSASYPPYSNGYSHSLTHAHSNTSLDSQYLCDCQTPGVDASRLSCRGYH